MVAAGAVTFVREPVGLGRGGVGVWLAAELGSEPRARWSDRVRVCRCGGLPYAEGVRALRGSEVGRVSARSMGHAMSGLVLLPARGAWSSLRAGSHARIIAHGRAA